MTTPKPDADQLWPEPSEQFVLTPYVEELTERALTYLQAGYPVHFSGPAGTGKTTLALHVAARLGRPVMLIYGDDEFGSSDLVGADHGYRKSKLIDNFIHSVLKTEENMTTQWVDNRLTTACKNGDTLIYDEFTRSRPEANNVLLSVLEEKILNLPKLRRSGEGYLEVHADFHAIFTSNPEEYAGVHKTQDALMDRLITIKLDHMDRESELEITRAKSDIAPAEAQVIVDIIRAARSEWGNKHRPTIRAAIMIAKVLAGRGAHAHWNDPMFARVCRDVLNIDAAEVGGNGRARGHEKVTELIQKFSMPQAGHGKKRTNPSDNPDDSMSFSYDALAEVAAP
jgi:gas vesicle protein GvpN